MALASCASFRAEADTHTDLRFVVAGHAYGDHKGVNPALHPPFLAAAASFAGAGVDFLILTGDFVRHCKEATWGVLQTQLDELALPVYLVKGNHEASPYCESAFERDGQGSIYQFDRGGLRFIVLDSQKRKLSISPDQVSYLKRSIETRGAIRTVVLLFHEVLWLADEPRYAEIRSNKRSRQANLDSSNYWEDIHPLLTAAADTRFYVIAGDVGGNRDAIAAFSDRRDNVHLIASGMGEVADENYLDVAVTAGVPQFRVIPLDPTLAPMELADFAVPRLLEAQARADRRKWAMPAALVLAGVTGAMGLFAWFRKRGRLAGSSAESADSG